MKQRIIIISVFAVLILSACKTKQLASKTVTKEENPVVLLIDQVQKAQPQFKSANVSKMAMELTLDERKVNVSATCKILKDSVIYLSIQPFMGIELFKAEFTQDSMRVFDKMNRKYYVSDYGYFGRRFGVEVSFNSLQALIFNQFFCVGKKQVLPDSCKFITLSSGRNEINFETESMQQKSIVLADNTIQQVILKAKNSSYQLQTNYEDYTVKNGVNYPQKITISATNQKSTAICIFSVLKFEFDTDMKFIPSIHDRYSKGDIEQLIKK